MRDTAPTAVTLAAGSLAVAAALIPMGLAHGTNDDHKETICHPA